MMRVDYYKVSPGGVKALHALQQYLRASGLEHALIELVKVRASLDVSARRACVRRRRRGRERSEGVVTATRRSAAGLRRRRSEFSNSRSRVAALKKPYRL
jgi:hypothetical protein